jgi:hypothetical protein
MTLSYLFDYFLQKCRDFNFKKSFIYNKLHKRDSSFTFVQIFLKKNFKFILLATLYHIIWQILVKSHR